MILLQHQAKPLQNDVFEGFAKTADKWDKDGIQILEIDDGEVGEESCFTSTNKPRKEYTQETIYRIPS